MEWDDDVTFRVDRIHLDEVELRVGRQDEKTWWWQVLYVRAVQVEGITHEGETEAFQRAQQHRNVWLEHELEAIKREMAEIGTEAP
jgi:endonuclease/exonuclease/phosphatase family metal-dependent hydrolase